MEKTTLGRTGLSVTVAGLGCGGFSRIGLSKGIDHAAGVVRAAYDAGLTFFDTAALYETQPAVGKGLSGLPRDSYTLSTKFTYGESERIISAEKMTESLERSLKELGVEYVDVFHIHGLMAQDYAQARDTFVPAMHKAKQQGKIRFLGVTERFAEDTTHEMLKLALPEDLFDVVMVGYNLLNQSAAQYVLPAALEKNLGVLCMFAVRRALWNREQLMKDIARILAAGQGGSGLDADSLDFLIAESIAKSLPEAAYRFCRHTPGITVTLTGTSNHDHLAENLESLKLPQLPASALERLHSLFDGVDCVSGQ
jgi:aryl-alcohol dehydrogenase-like predicted oxidoreductase